MTKVIERRLKLSKGEPLKTKRLRDAKTGETIVIRTVDAGSTNFASDLSKAFRSNVTAALRNRK